MDSAFKKEKKVYLLVFLKQCKCIQKENEGIKHIINDLESSSDDSDKNSLKLNIRIIFEAATLENVFLR